MSFIPNTTPTPNWLYNGEMKKMNETELKVVLLVTRKTLGWFNPMTNERKEQDNVSQSQFMKFTGKSHTAIAQAIQSSVESGWIIARDKEGNLCDTSNKRRRRKVWYQLGSVFTNKISKQESGLDENDNANLSNITKKSKQHNASNLSNILDNTKETLTKETIQKVSKDTDGKPSKENKDITNLVSYWEEKIGHLTVRPTTRRSFYNLLRSVSLKKLAPEQSELERAQNFINLLVTSRSDQFAPRIATPEDLLAKQNNLIDWFIRKKQKNGTRITKIA